LVKRDLVSMGRQSESEDKTQRKEKRKRRKNSRKTGFYYSFFTVVLIFCLIQIGYGAILNVGKIISYQGKMYTLENLLKKAQAKNEDLKTEKKVVTSDNSLEGIARNNLKMASEDEVLIIINKKVEEPKKEKKKIEIKWFRKKEKQKEDKPIGDIYIPQEVVEE
jgi:cell division protein FtsB